MQGGREKALRQFNKEGLAQPKGVLKGEGKFDVKEIESVKIRLPLATAFIFPSRKRGWGCVAENLHTPLSPLFRGESKKIEIPIHKFRKLCVIFGINGDVFVREVTCPDSIRTIPQAEFHADINVTVFHRCTQLIEVT